jgi:N6-adenosine-specific RNA methylase IME4
MYCKEIGTDRRVVNRWLRRWFQKELGPDKVLALPPKGKYNIIYCDPPWRYFEEGFKNQSQHYKTMELEDICKLPVGDLAADDCLLFMWVTFPMLDDFIDVLRCWGFEYSTVAFVWVKANKGGEGYFTGLGSWTRSNAEICVLARRGSVQRIDASVSQIVYAPVEEHSKKPGIVRDKIVQLVGDLPRIELFARQKTDGWETWGDQI